MIRVVAATAALLMAGYAYAQPKEDICNRFTIPWWSSSSCGKEGGKTGDSNRGFDGNRGSVRSQGSGPAAPAAAGGGGGVGVNPNTGGGGGDTPPGGGGGTPPGGDPPGPGLGNPGNNKAVGKAGEKSATHGPQGDRGKSR